MNVMKKMRTVQIEERIFLLLCSEDDLDSNSTTPVVGGV